MVESSALRIALVDPLPRQEWLLNRLEHLFGPAELYRIDVVAFPEFDHTGDHPRYDVVLVEKATVTQAMQRWPDTVVCSIAMHDDGSIQLVAGNDFGRAFAQLLSNQLDSSPASALRRLVERMNLVNEVSLEISAIHSLDDILSIIPDRLTQRFGYYHASVGVIDGDSIEMVKASQRSRAIGLERFRIPLSLGGIVPWVAQQGKTYLASDTQQDGLWIPGAGMEASRAELAVPVLYQGRVIAIIDVQSEHVNAFDQDDITVLHALAGQVGVAFENARLYQALVARARNLQQAIDELAEADRLRDELVGTVSHELRSPLTYVVGYVDLLLGGDLGDLTPEQSDSLQIVASKARMLSRLVSDILSYETNETAELILAEVQLTELGLDAAQDARLTAEKSGIQILTKFDSEMQPVIVDPERITQVFSNLLGNAIKFTPEDGTITVRMRQQAQTVRVEIEDTGLGIPADKVGHVFERFYQVDLKTRRRRGGVGLGLAICKQIVEGHGGEIGVTSEEGVGSTFYFELPFVNPNKSGDID